MSAGVLSFLAFAVAASATPGPNNLLVLATAARHGLRAALPLVAGVAIGFGFMVAVVGTGLAGPLAQHPALHAGMRWAGAAWMLLLAWRIARPGAAAAGPEAAPLGFWGICAFQWINPKAWVMALATASTHTVPGEDLPAQVLLLAGLFVLVGVPCVGAWAVIGARIGIGLGARVGARVGTKVEVGTGAGAGPLPGTPRRARTFDRVMGLLLAASVLPVLLGW